MNDKKLSWCEWIRGFYYYFKWSKKNPLLIKQCSKHYEINKNKNN